MGHGLLVVTGGDESLQTLPTQLGSDLDLDVSIVESANEALWEVRRTPPLAILANFALSDMSGLDLADILPNFGVSTQMILWTREENADVRQDAGEHGVYRYLSGPLSVADLRDAVQEAIRQAQADALLIEEETAESELLAAPVEPEPVPIQATPSRRTVERIDRQPPASEPAERQPPTEQPAPELRPLGRRIIPNPDPPYQPPIRSPRNVSPAPRPPERSINDRVAARKRDVPPPPAPTPTPAPTPAPVTTSQRRGGNLVVTQANLAPIQNILSDLWQNLGAQCTLLTDRAYGAVLAQHGAMDGLPIKALLPLLSTSFSTASEVAWHLRDEEATTLYIHDGTRYALYCFDIAQQFLLVIIFDKHIVVTKIGLVWVEAHSAIRKLKQALR